MKYLLLVAMVLSVFMVNSQNIIWTKKSQTQVGENISPGFSVTQKVHKGPDGYLYSTGYTNNDMSIDNDLHETYGEGNEMFFMKTSTSGNTNFLIGSYTQGRAKGVDLFFYDKHVWVVGHYENKVAFTNLGNKGYATHAQVALDNYPHGIFVAKYTLDGYIQQSFTVLNAKHLQVKGVRVYKDQLYIASDFAGALTYSNEVVELEDNLPGAFVAKVDLTTDNLSVLDLINFDGAGMQFISNIDLGTSNAKQHLYAVGFFNGNLNIDGNNELVGSDEIDGYVATIDMPTMSVVYDVIRIGNAGNQFPLTTLFQSKNGLRFLYVGGSFEKELYVNAKMQFSESDGVDAFMLKLVASSSAVMGVKQISGSSDQSINDLAFGNLGNVYAVGATKGDLICDGQTVLDFTGSAQHGGSFVSNMGDLLTHKKSWAVAGQQTQYLSRSLVVGGSMFVPKLYLGGMHRVKVEHEGEMVTNEEANLVYIEDTKKEQGNPTIPDVSPNPFIDQFTITTDKPAMTILVQLYNQQKELVFQKTYYNREGKTVSQVVSGLSTLQPDTYILHITLDGEKSEYRVIKE